MVRRTFSKWGFALFFGAVIALIAAEASEAAVGGSEPDAPVATSD